MVILILLLSDGSWIVNIEARVLTNTAGHYTGLYTLF